jgi:hypothetical protein
MTLILFTSLLYGFHLRDDRKVDSKITEISKNSMANLTIRFTKKEFYPEKSGFENESRYEKLSRKISDRNSQKTSELFGIKEKILIIPAGLATESIIYPLAPGTPIQYLNGPLDYQLQNPFLTSGKAYVVSKELPSSLVEISYTQGELSDLLDKANNSDLSYQEYQEEAEEIKLAEYQDKNVRKQVFSPENNSQDNFDMFPGGYVGSVESKKSYDRLVKRTKNNNLKELQLIHFVPSLFASFAMYYLLSGIVITGWRGFKKDIENLSEKENFFRNNLIISTIATSAILLTATTLWTAYTGSTLLVSHITIITQFLASAVFWTLLFAVTVNELRKKTKYSWILTGVTLNTAVPLILLSVFGDNNRFIWNTFILGATPVYPLLLGLFSEYGRIHGEKFLRQKLAKINENK